MQLMVIDGQGGRFGKQIIEGVRRALPEIEIVAVGTNANAAATMLKAGANEGASGENAVIVGCRTADVIAGPIGIVIADSLLGEVTPAMALAVGSSAAKKILVPINRCNHFIVGVPDLTINSLVDQAVACIVEQTRA